MHPVMIRDPQKRRLILQDPAKWRWPERIARDVTRRLDAPARRRDARTLMARLMATIPAPYAAAMQTQPVHMLLGAAHLGLAIAAAKSLILAANGPVRWVFHDDGSLTASDIGRLRQHLPGAEIVDRRQADERARVALARHRSVRAWGGSRARSCR